MEVSDIRPLKDNDGERSRNEMCFHVSKWKSIHVHIDRHTINKEYMQDNYHQLSFKQFYKAPWRKS